MTSNRVRPQIWRLLSIYNLKLWKTDFKKISKSRKSIKKKRKLSSWERLTGAVQSLLRRARIPRSLQSLWIVEIIFIKEGTILDYLLIIWHNLWIINQWGILTMANLWIISENRSCTKALWSHKILTLTVNASKTWRNFSANIFKRSFQAFKIL